MSDITFKGIDPKSEAGESIFFVSMDYWLELRDCIQMIMLPDFPDFPRLDAENAGYLADMLEHRLEFGLVQAYYELYAQRTMVDDDCPEDEIDEQISDFVGTMVSYTYGYVDFLRNCGGCEPE